MKYVLYITLFGLLAVSACKLDEIPDVTPDFVVDFEIMPLDGAQVDACPFPCRVQFSNISTPPSLVDFEWDFGFAGPDGSSEDKNPAPVTFPEVDTTFTITLIGYNDRGEEVGRKERVLNVDDPTAQPEPNFTIANDECFARCTLSFTNTSNNATRFIWDFGDDDTPFSTDSFDPVEHSYAKPGTYTVKLTAFNGPDGEEKMEEVEKTVTVNMRTFEDSQPGKGAGKAVRQRADGGYVVVGNTGVSGGNIYIMHTVPGGAKDVDTTLVVAESLGDITVADVIFFNDESVGIIGTVKDNAINRNRLVYALIDKDGSPLVAPVMLSEGHPDFEDRSVTVQRLLAVAGDRLAAIGEAIDINDGSSTLYIKVFDRNLISQQPGVLLGDPGGGSCFVYDAARLDGQLVIGTAVDDGGLVGKLFVTDDFGSPKAGFPKVIDPSYRGITGLVEGGDGNLYASVLLQGNQSSLIQLTDANDGTPNWETPILTENGVQALVFDPIRNGVLAVGIESDDGVLIVVNTAGSIVVPKSTYSFGTFNKFFHGTVTEDCGFILCGASGNDGNRYLVKTGEDG